MARRKIENNFILSKIIGKEYGFIRRAEMPMGNYKSKSLDYEGISWQRTRELEYGKNHCGATTGVNLLLYYESRGYENLRKKASDYEVFQALHRIIGNGPVLRISSKVKKYFKMKNYDLHYKSIRKPSSLKDSIEMGNPLSMLVSASWINWHWVLVLGWREYENGDFYIEIVDSWNRDETRFYKIESKLSYFFMTKYWIEIKD